MPSLVTFFLNLMLSNNTNKKRVQPDQEMAELITVTISSYPACSAKR
ncbi:MAG: hypothetical protein KBD64_03735 [Gammaproteobacteria bacterium]|nr:hypothetical protein [Gammaproteobacteria bacterium]